MGIFYTECLVTSDLPDGLRECLQEPLGWTAEDGTRVEVPAGFVTDFASVPRLFWRVLPPWDKHKRASVLHDWLYTEQLVSKKRADAYFYEAMGDLGVPQWKRWAMWAAVASCGFVAWNAHAKERAGRTWGLLGGLALILATSACHTMIYTGPNGETFKRSAPPWANLQFDSLQVAVTTNGTKTLTLEGYKSDLATGFQMGLREGKSLIQAIPK
jgi:hypothetical protein